MIYLGDGATDVPCMRLVKDLGGTSIAVYPPSNKTKYTATEKLLTDGRVNFISQADYTSGSRLHELVKIILEKIADDVKAEKCGRQGVFRLCHTRLSKLP